MGRVNRSDDERGTGNYTKSRTGHPVFRCQRDRSNRNTDDENAMTD